MSMVALQNTLHLDFQKADDVVTCHLTDKRLLKFNKDKADEQTVRVALDVFAELGFISIEGFDQTRTISVNSQASHMDLL